MGRYLIPTPTLPSILAVVLECEWYVMIKMCSELKLPLIKRTPEGSEMQYRLVHARDIAPLHVYTWPALAVRQPPQQAEAMLVVFDAHNFDFLDAGGWSAWLSDGSVYKLPAGSCAQHPTRCSMPHAATGGYSSRTAIVTVPFPQTQSMTSYM